MQSKTQFLLSRKINLVWGMDKTQGRKSSGCGKHGTKWRESWIDGPVKALMVMKNLTWGHGEWDEEKGISSKRTGIIVDTGNWDMLGDKMIACYKTFPKLF